jgi:serpin B
MDFVGAPGVQRDQINGWVAEQTSDRIVDLLPPPAINSDTRLVVVNAVYFLGRWAEPFDPAATRDETFTLTDGTAIEAPLMRRTGQLSYVRTDGVSIVELPYRGGELLMTLVIPHDSSGLAAVEARLSEDTFARWVGVARPARVRIVMPRFEMRAKIALSEHLKTLGIRQAFDRRAADFTGMAVPRRPDEGLFISEAFHQAFVKVDEVGTEAAAATAVSMGIAGGPPAEPVEVRADHPFLFAIREPSSGTILFLGRMLDPR